MRMFGTLFTVAIAVLATASPIRAQPGDEQVTACVQSQRQAMTLVETGHRRLELARQTNEPAALRAAMDDLQATLSAVKAELASCAQVAAVEPAADPHAGHVMPMMPAAGTGAQRPQPTPTAPRTATPPPPPTATPAPAADPHAAHVMPGAPPAPAQPGAARPAPPAATPDPHAGMAMPNASSAPAAKPAVAASTSPDMVEDPVSKTRVDPKTSLRVRYQGKMYYFRSDKERQEFIKNPGKYISAK